MLKELNSIAHGLLGLHGYPGLPLVAPEATAKGKRAEPPAARSAASVHAPKKGGDACVPALRVRPHTYFAW
jgi:hypothetical protein